MALKCILVDDEPLARKGLEEFIARTPVLKHCASLTSALETLEYLQANDIDIIFLDIQMPDMSGVELMRVLSDSPPQVIFTTAHREFALDGFELNAVDYLLKPISYSRFLKAVNKVLSRVEKDPLVKDHIFVKCDGELVKIAIDDIAYIETAKDYIFIHTPETRYMALVSMRQIEQKLPVAKFIRVHRSFLVGLKHVEKIEGNGIYIKGNRIRISRGSRTRVYNKIIGNRLIERS